MFLFGYLIYYEGFSFINNVYVCSVKFNFLFMFMLKLNNGFFYCFMILEVIVIDSLCICMIFCIYVGV